MEPEKNLRKKLKTKTRHAQNKQKLSRIHEVGLKERRRSTVGRICEKGKFLTGSGFLKSL